MCWSAGFRAEIARWRNTSAADRISAAACSNSGVHGSALRLKSARSNVIARWSAGHSSSGRSIPGPCRRAPVTCRHRALCPNPLSRCDFRDGARSERGSPPHRSAGGRIAPPFCRLREARTKKRKRRGRRPAVMARSTQPPGYVLSHPHDVHHHWPVCCHTSTRRDAQLGHEVGYLYVTVRFL